MQGVACAPLRQLAGARERGRGFVEAAEGDEHEALLHHDRRAAAFGHARLDLLAVAGLRVLPGVFGARRSAARGASCK